MGADRAGDFPGIPLNLRRALRIAAPAIATGLVFRLLLLALMAHRMDRGDAEWYSLVADNLLRDGVFSGSAGPPLEPTLYRPPLYPAFVAGVRLVLGHSLLGVELVQCILGTVSAALLGLAAMRISPRMGRWALWALALCPSDAVINGALLTETLVAFFLSAGMALPFLTTSRWRWPAMGILFGLAALTRDVYMLLIPVLAVAAGFAFLARSAGARRRAAVFATIALCGAATIAPWTARNYVVKHQVIPISRSVFNRSLWQGTWVIDNAHAANDGLGLPRVYPPWAFRLPGEREDFERAKELDEVERDAVYRAMFKRRLEAEPARVALTYVRRAPLVWVYTSRFDIFEFRPTALARGKPLYYLAKVGLFGFNVLAVALGFLGVALAIKARHRRMAWFSLPMLYSIAVFMPLDLIETRYTQPVYGCLLVCACFALRHLHVAWRRRAVRRAFAVRRAQSA